MNTYFYLPQLNLPWSQTKAVILPGSALGVSSHNSVLLSLRVIAA